MLGLWLFVACDWFVTEEMVAQAKDRDGDGYAAWQVLGPDCDDADPTVFPGSPEICGDEKDNDCNGLVDDLGEGGVVWYRDVDGDGYGTTDETRQACAGALAADGWSLVAGDCDDARATVNPDAVDLGCDGVDDDCDGTPDGDNLAYDADADGYGDHPDLQDCRDCNDADPNVHPGALELCDGADNDCDLIVDEEAVPTVGTQGYLSLGAAIEGQLVGGAPATVELCPGTYEVSTLQVHPKADVTVRGRPDVGPPARAVTIRAPTGNSVFFLTGGRLRLEQVEVLGASHQAALNVAGSGTLELEDCVVAESQRAIEVRASDQGGASVTLVDTILRDNDVGGGAGAGIYADGGYTLTITGGEIRDNFAAEGGGIYLTGNGGVGTLAGVSFTGNRAQRGGALAAIVFGNGENHGLVSLDGVTMANNVATEAGGAAYLRQFDVVAVGSATTEIRGNRSDRAGGGVSMLRSSLQGLDITGNTAIQAAGGIEVRAGDGPGDETSAIVESLVSGNSGADGCGVVVNFPAAPLRVERSDVTGHACGAPALFVESGSVRSVDTFWSGNVDGNVGSRACPGCSDVADGTRTFEFP